MAVAFAETVNEAIMRSEYEANLAIERYADMVRRICFLHLKDRQDTEDIFQTVFLKYILYSGSFENEAHEKAWLIRVTVNACKDLLKGFYRNHTTSIESIAETAEEAAPEHSDVLEAVLALPKKYKDVVYLFYYEGYTAGEIAEILKKKENTIYTLLARARKLLKEKLGGAEYE